MAQSEYISKKSSKKALIEFHAHQRERVFIYLMSHKLRANRMKPSWSPFLSSKKNLQTLITKQWEHPHKDRCAHVAFVHASLGIKRACPKLAPRKLFCNLCQLYVYTCVYVCVCIYLYMKLLWWGVVSCQLFRTVWREACASLAYLNSMATRGGCCREDRR